MGLKSLLKIAIFNHVLTIITFFFFSNIYRFLSMLAACSGGGAPVLPECLSSETLLLLVHFNFSKIPASVAFMAFTEVTKITAYKLCYVILALVYSLIREKIPSLFFIRTAVLNALLCKESSPSLIPCFPVLSCRHR